MNLTDIALGDTIVLPHEAYGELRWTAIDLTADTVTLCCEVLPDRLPFCAPEKSQRYIRIDMGAAGHKGGKQPAGVLRDDVAQLSPKERNDILELEQSTDKLNTRPKVDGSRLSAAHLLEYGCNQWPASSLRDYLSGAFLEGLGADIRNNLLPVVSDIVLIRTPARRDCTNKFEYPDMKSPSVKYNECVELYDEYRITARKPYIKTAKGAKGQRSEYIYYDRRTHARVRDMIKLPSHADFERYPQYFRDVERYRCRRDGEMLHCWLMDADTSQTILAESITELIIVISDASGNLCAQVDGCNARAPKGILPMITLRRQGDVNIIG